MWTDTSLGRILTNNQGMTLYYYAKDTPGSGATTCYGTCLANVTPFYTQTVIVPSPLSDFQVGMIVRYDGRPQTTYNGWPLYTYNGDSSPGSVLGNGLGGVWYVATVNGTVTGMMPNNTSSPNGYSQLPLIYPTYTPTTAPTPQMPDQGN